MRTAFASLIFALASVASSAGAQKIDLNNPTPSASDLYVGCYLLVHRTDIFDADAPAHKTFSEKACAVAALNAIVFREGTRVKSKFRFCMPDSPDVRVSPQTAMAFAYLAYFERYSGAMGKTNGPTAFVAALIQKWPCLPGP